MWKMSSAVVAIVWALAAPAAAQGVSVPARVVLVYPGVVVVDGDTLVLAGVRLRLWGIDAPEMDGCCGEPSRVFVVSFLEALGPYGGIRCSPMDVDRYRRVVVLCVDAGGLDLAANVVRLGWARDWPEFSDGYYRQAELEARSQRRGHWACAALTPPGWEEAKAPFCP